MATQGEHGVTTPGNTSASLQETVSTEPQCPAEVPSAAQFFNHQPWAVATVAIICGMLTIFNIMIYAEQAIHVNKVFTNPHRRKNTLVILGVFPVFSLTSLMSFYVPRSGTLMKLVSNAYLGNVLYRYVELLCGYFGAEPMYEALRGHQVALQSGPVCCCCFCLPQVSFGKRVYVRFKWMAIQVAYVRPMLMLLAAVLWTDGAYTPGDLSPTGTFLYISVLNVLSTLLAMYGLLCLTRMCQKPLAVFRVRQKVIVIQLLLITTALLGIILALLVQNEVIPCTPPLSSRDRARRLENGIVLTEMIPLALLARRFYCSEEDGKSTYSGPSSPQEDKLQEVALPLADKSNDKACPECKAQRKPLLHQEAMQSANQDTYTNKEPMVCNTEGEPQLHQEALQSTNQDTHTNKEPMVCNTEGEPQHHQETLQSTNQEPMVCHNQGEPLLQQEALQSTNQDTYTNKEPMVCHNQGEPLLHQEALQSQVTILDANPNADHPFVVWEKRQNSHFV